MDSGSMGRQLVMAFFTTSMEMSIKENLGMIRQMGRGLILTRKDPSMKESGKMILNTD